MFVLESLMLEQANSPKTKSQHGRLFALIKRQTPPPPHRSRGRGDHKRARRRVNPASSFAARPGKRQSPDDGSTDESQTKRPRPGLLRGARPGSARTVNIRFCRSGRDKSCIGCLNAKVQVPRCQEATSALHQRMPAARLFLSSCITKQPAVKKCSSSWTYRPMYA